MTKQDHVIICGDFGGVWNYITESMYEKHWLDWLNNRYFTTLFVDGNHENFERLYNYPVEKWHGGKVHKIRDSVFHLMRGEIFDIDNKKIFVFGGARSHDIQDGILNLDEEEKIYILLNKPIGYVTTVKDQFKRDTVMDLLKDIKTRIVPVGRLDMYTSGALILSNDGEFVNRITHPSHEVEKTYNVTVRGKVTKEDMQKLENGVDIGDYVTKPAKTKILKVDENKNISRFQIIIHEGKNRQKLGCN